MGLELCCLLLLQDINLQFTFPTYPLIHTMMEARSIKTVKVTLFCFILCSPINKSSVRESGKVKTGATEKTSTGVKAAPADSKARGTPDHPGRISNVCLI